MNILLFFKLNYGETTNNINTTYISITSSKIKLTNTAIKKNKEMKKSFTHVILEHQ